MFGAADEGSDSEDAYEQMLAGMDPLTRMMYGGADPRLQKQRRAAAQEKQRQRQLEQRRKKLLQRGYNRAAATIQRAYRAHLAAKAAAAREEAAFIITDVIRAVPLVRQAKKVAASLSKLRSLEQELRRMTEAYQQRPWGYRNTLWFVDQVEKVIFKLDEVQPHGSEFVRHCRKDVVREAQRSLRYADCVMRTFRRKAQVLARALRSHVKRHTQAVQDDAARVVQRVVRGVPKVQRARRVREALHTVRAELAHVEELRARYVDALSSAAAVLQHYSDDDSGVCEDDVLRAKVAQLQSLVTHDQSALLRHHHQQQMDHHHDCTTRSAAMSEDEDGDGDDDAHALGGSVTATTTTTTPSTPTPTGASKKRRKNNRKRRKGKSKPRKSAH